MVATLLTEHNQVVLNIEHRTIGNTSEFENGTITTCVVIYKCVVRERDVPFRVALILVGIAQLLFDESRERTIVERILNSLEVGQHIGLAIVTGTVNPAVATGAVAIVTAVEEQIVLDKYVVPQLVVGTLFADKATDNALERTVLDDQRVKCDSHTVREHVEEVVTRCRTDACLLVAIVVTHGVVEIDVIESELLHVDFTTLTSFR